METNNNNRQLIKGFMDAIWNKRDFEQLGNFLHSDFTDHSLPPGFSTDAQGLKKWVVGTSASFEHQSIIEDQVTENDKCIIKFRMQLKHIGYWRDIAPTDKEVSAIGYRSFRIADGKIIEHWALVDGNAIEQQLTNAAQGCKVQQ